MIEEKLRFAKFILRVAEEKHNNISWLKNKKMTELELSALAELMYKEFLEYETLLKQKLYGS